MSKLSEQDHNELVEAKRLLENPSLAARLTNLVGTPLEKAIEALPDGIESKIQEVTHMSLDKVAESAVFTMNPSYRGESNNMLHKVLAGASGGLGGAFGLPALAIELPISTGIMMRSIFDIARANDEDISSLETRLQALTVFALGGHSRSDDGTEAGYFVVRSLLAKAVSEAAAHIAAKGITHEAAPALVRLIGQITSRFSIPVTSKFATQAVPILGAIGGATVNTLFIDHFQDMARGHFTVRRLERIHGKELVEIAWNDLD